MPDDHLDEAVEAVRALAGGRASPGLYGSPLLRSEIRDAVAPHWPTVAGLGRAQIEAIFRDKARPLGKHDGSDDFWERAYTQVNEDWNNVLDALLDAIGGKQNA